MKLYTVTIQDDQGRIKLHTSGLNKIHVRKIVMVIQKCPARSIVKIQRRYLSSDQQHAANLRRICPKGWIRIIRANRWTKP